MSKYTIHHTIETKKSRKIQSDDTLHYPNKDEAALLRRIKAQTGLSEKEIRSIHMYRKILSEAQKEGQKSKYGSDMEKFYRTLIKKACKETGLAKEHPDTLVKLDEIIEDSFSHYTYYDYDKLSAKKAIERYGRKK